MIFSPFSIIISLLLQVLFVPATYAKWARWEGRTVDCSAINRPCRVLMDDGTQASLCRQFRDPEDNAQRFDCPLKCPKAARLSAVWKFDYEDYQSCLQFVNFSKEKRRGDFYMWVKRPCVSKLKTWCQFNDVE